MSASAKLTSKGQITLPKEMRDALGLKPGDRIDFRQTDGGNYEIVANRKTFADLRNLIRLDGAPPSVDDIVEMVDRARQKRAADITLHVRDNDG